MFEENVFGQWFIGVYSFQLRVTLYFIRDKSPLPLFSCAAVRIDTRKRFLTTLFRCLLRFITTWTNLR